MLKLTALCSAAALLALSGCVAPTQEPPAPAPAATPAPNPSVGGAEMDAAQPLLQNLSRSNEHGRLVAAVRAAGLDQTLSGAGPVTLFAPTDQAFDRLPNGTLTTLLDPSNKWLLGQIVNYHVVPGAKTRAQIAADARSGGGTAAYRTAQGGTIRVSVQGNAISVADIHGNRSNVTIADVRHSNGVMHVLDAVLLPAS